MRRERVARVGRFGGLRSTGVRLTLVAMGTMLLFHFVEPWIHKWVIDAWPPQSSSRPENVERAPELARLIRNPELARSDPASATWLEDLSSSYRAYEIGFFVLDEIGDLIYRSADLTLADPADLTSNSQFELVVEGERVGMAFAYLYPVATATDRIGLLGVVNFYFHDLWTSPVDPAAIPLDDSCPIYVQFLAGESSEDREFRQYERRGQLAKALVTLGTALVLGLGASLFLSRRLVRLTKQTQHIDEHGIPGPFHARGSDEIAVLSRAMNDMRERLRDLVVGLERRDAARREWVAQVSHDLRTPLTSLQICLDRAENEVDRSRISNLPATLREAQHDARRLHTLTEDLLDAARLEAGAPLEFEPVLPLQVLRDAIRSVGPIAERDGVRLSMAENGPVPEIEADGERLVRACENLLHNSIRHASDSVQAGVLREPGAVVFWIRDDGEGFGGEPGGIDLERIRSRAGRAEGASLGLLVVERVAEAHGGQIELVNLNEGGAVTRLRIPDRPASSKVRAITTSAASLPRS